MSKLKSDYYACFVDLGDGEYAVMDAPARDWIACRRTARQLGMDMSLSIPVTYSQARRLSNWFDPPLAPPDDGE